MNILENAQDNWKVRFAILALPTVGVFYAIGLVLWFWNPGTFDVEFQFRFFAVMAVGFLITWVLIFFIRKDVWKYCTMGILGLLTVSVAILAGHFSPGEIRDKAREIGERSRMTAESQAVPSPALPTPPQEEEWVSISSNGNQMEVRNVRIVGDILTLETWSSKGRGKIGQSILMRVHPSSRRFFGRFERTYPDAGGEVWLEQVSDSVFRGATRDPVYSSNEWIPTRLEKKR